MKDKNRRLSKLIPIFLALFVIFSTSLSHAIGPDIPAPTKDFYFYDEMGVLSQQTKDEIMKTNIELEGKTKAQVVVATINDLQEYPIEDYALEMFRKWGIGDKEMNNGVLILVGKEPTSNKFNIFIATGYGLEGRLNDGKVGRIIDEYFITNVQRDNLQTFDKALLETFRAVISQVIVEYNVEIEGNYQEYIENLQAVPQSGSNIIIMIFIILVLISIFRGPRGPRRRGYGRYRRGYFPFPMGGFGSGGFSGGSSGGGGFSGGGGSSGGGGAGRSF
ncbi:TPM domain-containing protein [Lagierella sp.]|uniref:TPM domain-containing protein n=1 Tax=Lagierella sp. TaxID=2849657 RepID=UPI002634E2D7|nr:TPM domain-containing protein [Lagierella sp.]